MAVAVFKYLYDGGSQTETGVTGTATVKSKPANALGLYDMSGNIAKWCFEWYTALPNTFRVHRGASYLGNDDDTQVGYTNKIYPYYAYSPYGFRFVRTY